MLWRRLASGVQCRSPRVTGDKLLISAVVHGLCKLGQERPACYSGLGTMKCQVQMLSLLWPHSLPSCWCQCELCITPESEETLKKSLCICSPSLVTCHYPLWLWFQSPETDISRTWRLSGETGLLARTGTP